MKSWITKDHRVIYLVWVLINKEKKPECFSFTNQGGNKKSYAEPLKSLVKKEESKKVVLSSQDKNRNNMVPKRPNRY